MSPSVYERADDGHGKIEELLQRLERDNKLTVFSVLLDHQKHVMFTELAKNIRSLVDIREQRQECAFLITWKEDEALRLIANVYSDFVNGRVVVDNEERELTSNIDFLERLPAARVNAVSFQDESFWLEAHGEKFLAAHVGVLKRDIKITRIFILDRGAASRTVEVLKHQEGMGIEVRVVFRDQLKADQQEDFVLYDDKYVRYAKLVSDTGVTTLKHATLSWDEDQVRAYDDKFNALSARSRLFDDALARELPSMPGAKS